jgi:hypothetical protein
LERAFELARSGDFVGVAEIRKQLKRENFGAQSVQLSGPALVKQLRSLCDAARSERAAEPR